MNRLAFEVARTYLRSRQSRLISAVSLLSVAGIALGVASLVVAMGLLSGYRGEIRQKLIGANVEIVVFPLSPASGGDPGIAALEARLARLSRVRATAPVIYQSGLALSAATPEGADAVLKGVDAARERRVSQIEAYLPDVGRILASSPDGVPSAAIGRELARLLDVREGDDVTLAVPDNSPGGARFAPRTGRFRVTRIFQTNFYEYDSEWVFLDREALRSLARMAAPANVVEVKLDTTDRIEEARDAVEAAAGRGFSVSDWRSMNSGLFSALAIQQTTLFLVIGLIVAVSTFNIVATLVMTVQEKKRDIAVMTVAGAEPGLFSRVFLMLGGMLGGAGVAAGILLGSLICLAVTEFRLLSFPPGVAEIYFVSFVPFRVRPGDLLAIVGFSAAAILLAAWVPARRASRTDVAQALRYE